MKEKEIVKRIEGKLDSVLNVILKMGKKCIDEYMEDEIKKEKTGITSEEALKAFSDLGEALRKDMVREEPWPRPEEKEYRYTCPVCKTVNYSSYPVFDKIPCSNCSILFYAINGSKLKPEWKILDVNDLSECPDILTGVYEFENIQEHISPLDILSGCVMGQKRRYRKTTTTKKSHEELAEDIVKASHEEHGYNYINGGHLFKEHFPVERMKDLDEMIKDNVQRAFIAGRKSMEES